MKLTRHTGKTSVLAIASALFACLAYGQTDDAPEPEEGDAMDEIVVTAEKPGDRSSVETPYEDELRARILKEYNAMARDQEELEWRQEPSLQDPSRISFGYRPQDRRRDDTQDHISTLPLDKVKPATVFRFEF